MDIINWKDEYSVGVKEIDKQHKELVNMINELIKTMKSVEEQKKLNEVLNNLTDYTIKHFSTEEELMMKYDYEELEAHKEEHEQLVNDIKQFRSDFLENKISLSFDVAKYLENWLINHIMEADKKLGKFLNRLAIY